MSSSTDQNPRKFTFRHNGGTGGETVRGWYVTTRVNGKEVLLYAESFAEPKKMEKLGDEITIELPNPNIQHPGLTILAMKEPKITDEVGRNLGYGSAAFALEGWKGTLLESCLDDWNENIALRRKGRRQRKERGPDPEAQCWHNEIIRLKYEEKLSAKAISARLKASGHHMSEEGIKSVIKRWKKRHPGAN